jgi:hypothetical protein
VLPIIDKLNAMLAGMTRADIEALPPAQRERLAQLLRHLANIADPPARRTVEIPKGGVLGDLGNGGRAE